MDVNVPYMMSVKNLSKILDAMQNAAVPSAFGLDFLKDLGFTSSNDRGIIKLLKYLGMLDASGRPQASYREFVDHTKARGVLADRLCSAYDDLFASDQQAHTKTTSQLKGWFKTKTGASDSVAEKMATTFKAFASYADFSKRRSTVLPEPSTPEVETPLPATTNGAAVSPAAIPLGLTYRIEVHLPDTTNVDTYRAIFRAIREELVS